MTQPSNSKPPLGDQIAEAIRQILKPGGVTVGSGVAFWQLMVEDSVGKAVVAFLIGAGTSYGARMLKPLHEKSLQTAEQVGETFSGAFEEISQRAIAAASGFEKRYLLCQASDCESVRAEGMQQRESIFEPLLKDVFVELQIDSSAQLPGLSKRMPARAEAVTFRNQTIWDFLASAKREKAFRQLAILAWGGFGKTTLLKHVAHRYGIGKLPDDAPEDVPSLVPVLIVLRKHRAVLCQAEPPELPTFINEHHIPELPEAHRLQPVPPNWAKEMLQKGRALVMFDGFDEVPKAERPKVTAWINAQMRQYRKSVFIVTSRPKAYREQDFADRLDLSTRIWVQPFDDEQRRRFVTSWYLTQEQLKARRDTPEVRKVSDQRAKDLLSQISAEAELKDLAKNPLLLNMIATFHRLYPGAALPKRRVDLYREICELQLKSRPRDRRLETVLLELESEPILGKVALSMMQQTLKRIEADALLQEVEKALEEHDEAVNAEDFLQDVVRISEIIVKQEDEYEFAHLSFQEYLAAAYIAEKPEEREAKLLYDCLGKDWWKATVLLYVSKVKKPAGLIREAKRQGHNDLAYECWQQTTKRIDESLQAELELQAVIFQVRDARYAGLEQYLQNEEWKKADNETYRLMITEVGKEYGQWFDREELLNFPCEPLKTIDGLWIRYSEGKFGFSVQKKIYVGKCGGILDGKYNVEVASKLFDEVGWGNWRYDLTAPMGHLPAEIFNRSSWMKKGSSREKWVLGDGGGEFLFSRMQTCEL